MTTETVTWIDPDGASTVLKIGLNSQMGDMIGRFMPPILHQEDVLPFQPGGRHRLAIQQSRDFVLPINLPAASGSTPDARTQSVRLLMRSIVSTMDPTRGAGIIRVLSPLGDIREIECYYVSGLDMDENPIKTGRYNQQALITFRSYDPFWRDQSDTSRNWNITAVSSFFPIFPLRLTASQIVVADTIVNGGDTITWPVWQIFGPGGGAGGIVLTNNTIGQSISFMTTSLGSGESIIIDTRPGFKLVTKQDGSNLFGDLDPTSVLWPLARGNNSISLQLNGGTAGATALQINYRLRYLSP